MQRGIDLYRVQSGMGHKNHTIAERCARLGPSYPEEIANVLAE
jgi:hypothetical protein